MDTSECVCVATAAVAAAVFFVVARFNTSEMG